MDLLDRFSLSILVVTNNHLSSPTSFVTMSFSSSSLGLTSPPPLLGKLFTALLRTIDRTTNNFGSVNLTCNSQFDIISTASPHYTALPTPSSSPS